MLIFPIAKSSSACALLPSMTFFGPPVYFGLHSISPLLPSLPVIVKFRNEISRVLRLWSDCLGTVPVRFRSLLLDYLKPIGGKFSFVQTNSIDPARVDHDPNWVGSKSI